MADRNTKIRGSQIRDLTITGDDIADVTIPGAKLVNDTVTGTKLADAVAGAGLVKDGAENLAVNVDAATIEINADTLRVKDGGITEPKLDIVNATTDGYVLSWSDGDSQMKWVDPISGAVQNTDFAVEPFAGDGVEDEFVLADDCIENSLIVTLNGLIQEKGVGKDYTYTAGTKTIAFATVPDNGDNILAYYVKP